MLKTYASRFFRTFRKRTFSWLLCSLPLIGSPAVGQPVLVKDVNPGAAGSNAQNLVNVNGTLYFTAHSEASGHELWKSNGTAAGTVLVKDLTPGAGSSSPLHLTNVNGTLYFAAGNGLYKTDGTAAGTVLLKSFYASPSGLTALNGTLYFAANDGATGTELWKSDGTAAGTVLVKDILPGATGGFPNDAWPSGLLNANGTLYFSAAGGLYKSNGTAAGTTLVRSFPVGLSELTYLNGEVYFTDNEDLWKSDGTTAGTVRVKGMPFWQHPNGYYLAAEPRDFTVSGGRLFFITSATYPSLQLWKSDGTAAGTTVVRTLDAVSVSTVSNLADVNGTLYYAHSVGINNEALYKTDGTTVTLLKSFGYGYPDVQWLTNVNGRLYFAAGMDGWSNANIELWTSNGTPDGTVQVADINPNANQDGSAPAWLTDVNGVLFFTADNGAAGRELWKYTPDALAFASVRLNAGGSAYTTLDNRAFLTDSAYSGGNTYAISGTVDIQYTYDDRLYRSERWGTFGYTFRVAPGTYEVVLHFAEIYWGNARSGGVGSRRFNVDIEGQRKLTEYDIFARAGGALKAVNETFRVTTADDRLVISFVKGSADQPKVSAIEIIPVEGAARTAAAGSPATEAWAAELYPNPVSDQLTVRLPFGVKGVKGTAVADATGNVRLTNAHRAAGNNELKIATGSLPKGFYLLRLNTDQGSRVVRFVRQ